MAEQHKDVTTADLMSSVFIQEQASWFETDFLSLLNKAGLF